MNSHRRGLILVHVATLLFGFPGLFAEWLGGLFPVQIVSGRTLFASVSLIIGLSLFGRMTFPKDKNIWFRLVSTGIILAFHWLAFFKAIQMTNVAIGLLTFSTFPLFTGLLEPLFFREKISSRDILLALLVLVGVSIVGKDALNENFGIEGVLWGLAGAASFSVMAIINRGLNKEMTGLQIAAYQNLFAFLTLIPFNLGLEIPVNPNTWGLLILLGILFTGIAHGLFNESLAHIKASTASLIVSMEPLYGIVLALILLNQKPGVWTMVGGFLILMAGLVPTLSIRKEPD
ncbi:MAG: DMT family transporter [Bacteroidia bacterium]|nr:DMT family transporter [Bacteroidia bacterium]